MKSAVINLILRDGIAIRSRAVQKIAARSDIFSSGHLAYQNLVNRLVELGLTEIMLRAERVIFSGTNHIYMGLVDSPQFRRVFQK